MKNNLTDIFQELVDFCRNNGENDPCIEVKLPESVFNNFSKQFEPKEYGFTLQPSSSTITKLVLSGGSIKFV